jgi:hypothetical protein
MDDRERLAMLVREQSHSAEAWQSAEAHLLSVALRERLAALGVAVTPDVAVALMATATLLGTSTPEWGGDARCTLEEIALLGLDLLDG